MIKNPAYIIPLAGLYIFSFGYVYEWGYLSEFNVAHQVVNHTYAEFLVLATHAMTVAVTSPNASGVLFAASLTFAITYALSRPGKFQEWTKRKAQKSSEAGVLLANMFLITFSPLCLILLFLVPGLLGSFEAKSLKKASERYWQEVEIKGAPPLKLTGMTIRKISGNILFYQNDDPVTHVIPAGDILAIRHRTTSHNKSIQPTADASAD